MVSWRKSRNFRNSSFELVSDTFQEVFALKLSVNSVVRVTDKNQRKKSSCLTSEKCSPVRRYNSKKRSEKENELMGDTSDKKVAFLLNLAIPSLFGLFIYHRPQVLSITPGFIDSSRVGMMWSVKCLRFHCFLVSTRNSVESIKTIPAALHA